MRVIVFGVGKYYKNRKDLFPKDTEVVAGIDNNCSLWGKTVDNLTIYSPDNLKELSFDIIILMSLQVNEMKIQLLGMGISKEIIFPWNEYYGKYQSNIKCFYGPEFLFESRNTKILLISGNLGYHGGSMAAIYAYNAMMNLGYDVLLCTPSGDTNFINEMSREGVSILVCPSITYIYIDEHDWIKKFDIVFVNVFPMIRCACEISLIKPVIWWIHESSATYPDILKDFAEYAHADKFKNINVCAVSNMAKINFEYYFPNAINRILEYGIPDIGCIEKKSRHGDRIVFAIIGRVSENKAQDIFVRAALSMKQELLNFRRVEFWIIGFRGDGDYENNLEDLITGNKHFKLWGSLVREKIIELYKEIDVVVCASKEDSLPIAITEGMMYGKVCIVSENAGTSQYITDGYNGLIFKTGDVSDLTAKMNWILDNYEQRTRIGLNARKVYEDYFSMEKFTKRLKSIIENTDGRVDRR